MATDFRFSIIKFNWQLGIALIVLFGVVRFILVIAATKSGSFNLVSLVFIAMALMPFILLNQKGRAQIGIQKAIKPQWLLYAFLLGILISTGIYLLGLSLYENTDSNWYVYISQSYGNVPMSEISPVQKASVFIVFCIITMTFSPIGEELLYRGMIHESFVVKFGQNKASAIDSMAFALVHLPHFGLVFSARSWSINWLPALIWMLLMFASSRLFFYCRVKSGTIMGAIFCHAGFNLAMTYFIFYHIL